MSQGCALLILRSKGQRSRSWRMVIWKWFPDDNWLCNQPMIMKLHTLTPHEFVGVGGGPVLLQQYFQYAFICCPYMLPLLFCVVLNIDLAVICYCLWYYIAKKCFRNTTCIITQRKPLKTCRQMDRQMDIVNSEFYLHYNFANQYALLCTHNAYRDITPCLFL